MALSGDHVLRVEEIPSKRWEIALAQLDSGGAMTVLDGDPSIGLQRWVGWPSADGHIHVSIFTEVEPKALDQQVAARDATAGLQTLTRAVLADPRLADLIAKHGVIKEYVFDYGHGAVKVGDVLEDGSVTLR